MKLLRDMLAHPLTRGMDLDDPQTTALRRQIIAEKPFLRTIYAEWYQSLVGALPDGPGPVLELGAGAGFLAGQAPNLITSDVFRCPGIAAVLDGQQLPFGEKVLRGIVMTNVLHHLPQVERFFAEAERCLRPGGVVAMIEPWVTPWSRLVYTYLHHEPFAPDAQEWRLAAGGPLSEANGGLPWIIFARDRARFEDRFPALRIAVIQPMMPVRYLLSGGVSMRTLTPGWSSSAWRAAENFVAPLNAQLGMFARIVLVRR